jgi:hypothetical protein
MNAHHLMAFALDDILEVEGDERVVFQNENAHPSILPQEPAVRP